jgi:hypothetical protein
MAQSDKATPKKTRVARAPRARRPGESLSDEEIALAKQVFLADYAKYGNVGHACDKARIHRSTFYRWQEHEETFGIAFGQAKADYDDVLRQEIHRRAHDGVLEPVVSAGKLVARVRKYSDTLLIFQAKSRMPEYREKQQVEISGQLDINTLAAEADAKFDTFIARSAAETVLGQPDAPTEG